MEEEVGARTQDLVKEIGEYQYCGEEVLKVTVVEAMSEKKVISAYEEFETVLVGILYDSRMVLAGHNG